jgi:hypothetical protein
MRNTTCARNAATTHLAAQYCSILRVQCARFALREIGAISSLVLRTNIEHYGERY